MTCFKINYNIEAHFLKYSIVIKILFELLLLVFINYNNLYTIEL